MNQSMEVGRRRHRFPVEGDNSSEHQPVDCTGGSCKSCSATVVADCVALCCCPCSIVSLLFLAFLKVPWMVGRKCVRLLMVRKRKRELVVERKETNLVKEWEREVKRLGMDFHSCEDVDISTARFEAEKVWLELYQQTGQIGFGRVSFNS